MEEGYERVINTSPIKQRVLKTAAAKSAEIAILLLVRFFSVPLFLYAWTPDLYGEWLILYSLMAYLSMGNLGFAQAAANEMTMAVARGERAEALRTYQSMLSILLMISLALLLLVVLATFLLPVGSMLGVEGLGDEAVDSILVLFLLYVFASFFMNLMSAGFRCEGAYHRAILFMNLSLILELALIAVVVLLGRGPMSVAMAMLASRLVSVLAMRFDLGRTVSWLSLSLREASRVEIRRLLSPSLSFAAYPAGNVLLNQGVILGIGSMIGPVEVVVFSSVRTLTNLATHAYDMVNQAFYPEVSMAFGSENRDLARRLHRYSCQASLWLGLLALIGLATLGPWIFKVWTHGKVPLDPVVFYGFVSIVVARAMWYTSFVVPSSINRHQVITLKYLGASFVGLLVALLMLKIVGLAGGLVGFGMVEFSMIFFVLPVSLGFVGDRLSIFSSHIIRPPSLAQLRRLVAR